MRQSLEPAAEEGVDVVGAKRIAELAAATAGSLQLQETVVERFVADALAVKLPLGPLVAVDPDANGERGVRGELDEA